MAVSIDAHILLRYFLADDYLERRGEFRAEHLDLIGKARTRGEIILAGALSDPSDEALLIFRGDDPTVVHDFARADPYVNAGLVTRYEVRIWMVVSV